MPSIKPSPGQLRLYSGDFNVMSQEWQADGSVILTMSTLGHDHDTVLHVRDLYGPNETVISESLVDHAPPAHIIQRQQQAGKP